MKIKTHSWHTILYLSTLNKLPYTLCNYFWGLLFSIIMIPVTIPTHCLNLYYKSYSYKWDLGFGITFMIIFMGAVVAQIINTSLTGGGFIIFPILYGYGLLGWLVVSVFLYVVFQMCRLFEKGGFLIKNKLPKKEKKSVIKEFFKNLKEKNCTIIEWDDKKEEK